MNKYLKGLMLSGGLMGAIAPCAIKLDKTPKYDLGYIYNQVERMQKAVPNLSRINHSLNIDLVTTEDVDEINQNQDLAQDNNSDNIIFSTTDEQGNQTRLDNNQTINYLNETLNQTNTEYENLRQTLISAINDTMAYLESYRDNPQELTNEQKIYIKEHSNSIKYLAETLEDLSEEVICTIDGKDCDDCDDCDDINETAGIYISTIQNLENRIQTLQNAINSLQFISSIGNPLFNSPTFIPRHALYHITKDIKDEDRIDSDDDIDESMEVEHIEDSNADTNSDTNTNSDTSNTNSSDANITNDSSDNTDNSENDKPTTFNLKSNIDTYAPKKRNIDTFFNTALLDDQYMYGGGGYGYGYGMPYNGYGMYGGGFGNPYNGYNSNMINRDVINQQTNSQTNAPITNTSANIDNSSNTSEKTEKPKKIHVKKAKNIDTYTLSTIQSNINTMGESKISKFIKDKFNGLRKKVKNKKDDIKNTQQQDKTNNLDNVDHATKRVEDTINNKLDQVNDSSDTDNIDAEFNAKTFDLDNKNDTNNDVDRDVSGEMIDTPTSPQFQPDIKVR